MRTYSLPSSISWAEATPMSATAAKTTAASGNSRRVRVCIDCIFGISMLAGAGAPMSLTLVGLVALTGVPVHRRRPLLDDRAVEAALHEIALDAGDLVDIVIG